MSTRQQLFWVSFLSLFFELIVVRWLPADIRMFTVFKNFPLAACFVGFGVGCALGQPKHFRLSPVALLLFVGVTKIFSETALGILPFQSERNFDWFQVAEIGIPYWLYFIAYLASLLLLLAGPFLVSACIGARLGALFNEIGSLQAYSINLAGALVGTLAFALASFSGMWPDHQLLIAVIILLVCLKGEAAYKSKILLPCLLAVGLMFIHVPQGNAPIFWTPYTRLQLKPFTFLNAKGMTETGRYRLEANRGFQQEFMDWSDQFLQRKDVPADIMSEARTLNDMYAVPYSFVTTPQTLENVLILASGTGNDVQSAIIHGAKHIDAVEIDPVTLSIGKKYNPLKPYSSSSVNAVCDDARHFLRTTKRKYDLIIFAFLDSITVLSSGSSVRLDNFVYTKQSIESALKVLQPDGLICLQFDIHHAWFADRLFKTMTQAAGYSPIVFAYNVHNQYSQNYYFLLGQAVKDKKISLPKSVNLSVGEITSSPSNTVLTDDWPYLYLAPVAVDKLYLFAVAEILLLGLFVSRRILLKQSSNQNYQMMSLGAAFLLLELQSIAHLALLYGNTWLTLSVVLSGVLTLILLANVLVLRLGEAIGKRIELLYLGLFAAIACSYLLPFESILANPFPSEIIGYAIVTAVALMPMFFAALVFSTTFKRVENPAVALGFNSLGAVIGALCEYATTYIGINNLVLVAGGFYALAFVLLLLQRKATTSAANAG